MSAKKGPFDEQRVHGADEDRPARPTTRDLLIAAEQPGEVEASVIEHIETDADARGFVKAIIEQDRFIAARRRRGGSPRADDGG